MAETNRAFLSKAGVLAILIVGEPGCGKTSLIVATVRHCALRVGAIIADPAAHRHESHLAELGNRVVQIEGQRFGRRFLIPEDVQRGIQLLDLSRLDVLLIETAGAIDDAIRKDLG